MNFPTQPIAYKLLAPLWVSVTLVGCFAEYSSPQCKQNEDCPEQFDHCYRGYCILKKGAVWPPAVADAATDVPNSADVGTDDTVLDVDSVGQTGDADSSESFCAPTMDNCCALPLLDRNIDPDCTLWETVADGSMPAMPAIDVAAGRFHLVYRSAEEGSCVLHSLELETGLTVANLPFPCERPQSPVILPDGDVLVYSLSVFRFDLTDRKIVWWEDQTKFPGPITLPVSVQGYQTALISEDTLFGIDAVTGERIAKWSHPFGASLSGPLWKGTTLFLATSEGTVLRFPTLYGGDNTSGALGAKGIPGSPVPWLTEVIAVVTASLAPKDNVFAVRTFGSFPALAGSNRVENVDLAVESVVTARGILVIRQTNGSVVLVSPNLGLQPLDLESLKLTSPMAVTPNSLLSGTETGVVAIHPVTGNVQWTYTTRGPVHQAPVPVGDGTAIVVTTDTRIYRIGGVPGGLDFQSAWPKPRGDLANTGASDDP